MRTALLTAMVIILWYTFVATNASAQCAFNSAPKAKKLKLDMVRAFGECTTSNATTAAGVPACVPPTPLSPFKFGSKGSCRFQTTSRPEIPCSDGSGEDCFNLIFQAKCKDILEVGGDPINSVEGVGSGAGWTLSGTLRMTTDDASAGDVVIIDLPFGVQFPASTKGKLKQRIRMTDLCISNALPCPYRVSPCSSIEIMKPKIFDPQGGEFATPGSSAR